MHGCFRGLAAHLKQTDKAPYMLHVNWQELCRDRCCGSVERMDMVTCLILSSGDADIIKKNSNLFNHRPFYALPNHNSGTMRRAITAAGGVKLVING